MCQSKLYLVVQWRRGVLGTSSVETLPILHLHLRLQPLTAANQLVIPDRATSLLTPKGFPIPSEEKPPPPTNNLKLPKMSFPISPPSPGLVLSCVQVRFRCLLCSATVEIQLYAVVFVIPSSSSFFFFFGRGRKGTARAASGFGRL